MAAVVTQTAVSHRYAPIGLLGVYTGWFEGLGISEGDAGGQTNTITLITTAPQERIYRIDTVKAVWTGAVGDAFSDVRLGLSAAKANGFADNIAKVDTSGSVEGSVDIPVPNGWMWRSNNPGDGIAEWGATNANNQVLRLIISGVFYEARAGQ